MCIGNVQKQEIRKGNINKSLRHSYDANFKVSIMTEAEKSKNCMLAKNLML